MINIIIQEGINGLTFLKTRVSNIKYLKKNMTTCKGLTNKQYNYFEVLEN